MQKLNLYFFGGGLDIVLGKPHSMCEEQNWVAIPRESILRRPLLGKEGRKAA